MSLIKLERVENCHYINQQMFKSIEFRQQSSTHNERSSMDLLDVFKVLKTTKIKVIIKTNITNSLAKDESERIKKENKGEVLILQLTMSE